MKSQCRRALCVPRQILLATAAVTALVALVLLHRGETWWWGQGLPLGGTRIVSSEYMGTGQMGNSMFEYMSSYVLARRHRFRFVVLEWGAQVKAYRRMKLLFNVTAPCSLELGIFADRRLREKGWGVYSPELEQANNFGRHTRIEGWLQSWRYLAGDEQFVRSEFALTDYYRGVVDKFFNAHGLPRRTVAQAPGDLPKTVVVAVHVRRGDMLLFPEKYRMASVQYVASAMGYFHEKYYSRNGSNLVFVVATDDPTWTRRAVSAYWNDRGSSSSSGTVVYTHGTAEEDMAILSSCHHAVITGGSYGWWAAWLTGGEVVYFRDFIWNGSNEWPNYNAYDYYPPSWIGLT